MQPENLGFVLRQQSLLFIVIIGKLSQLHWFVNMLIQLFIHQCAKRNTRAFLMRSICVAIQIVWQNKAVDRQVATSKSCAAIGWLLAPMKSVGILNRRRQFAFSDAREIL